MSSGINQTAFKMTLNRQDIKEEDDHHHQKYIVVDKRISLSFKMLGVWR